MANPASLSSTALKRDRLFGGIGASLAREARFGIGSIMRPGVATLTQAETDRLRTFSIGLDRDALPDLQATRAAHAGAAAMFPGIRASEALRGVNLFGGARLSKDAQRILERGGGLDRLAKTMERYKAIQDSWMGIGSVAAQRAMRQPRLRK